MSPDKTKGWWRPPGRIVDRDANRRVTFLELFYDLVYVVVIAEIGHALATHVDPRGVLEAAFLFVLVWLAWLNGALYHDLHGHDDVRTRVFTFAQMFVVAAMAVFVHAAFGEGAVGFGLSFAAYQLLLSHLWWQTGVHEAEHRPLAAPYVGMLVASAALFGGGAFAPEAVRTSLWSVGLVLTLVAPLVAFLREGDPDSEHTRGLDPGHSGVERFDLFTIIVLGEVIVGVVQGLAERGGFDGTAATTAGLGMLVAVGLWWLYFDFVSGRLPIPGRRRRFPWIVLHLPTTAGIVAAGAATMNVVEHAGEPLAAGVRWLLVLSVALALLGIGASMSTLRVPEHPALYRTAQRITLAAAVTIAALGFAPLSSTWLMVASSLALLVPVLWSVRVWVRIYRASILELG